MRHASSPRRLAVNRAGGLTVAILCILAGLACGGERTEADESRDVADVAQDIEPDAPGPTDTSTDVASDVEQDSGPTDVGPDGDAATDSSGMDAEPKDIADGMQADAEPTDGVSLDGDTPDGVITDVSQSDGAGSDGETSDGMTMADGTSDSADTRPMDAAPDVTPDVAPDTSPDVPMIMCPPPDYTGCGVGVPQDHWAKDPQTAACCKYARECYAPSSWQTYTSQQACQSA